ncbi:MAG: hypothetical protein KZQ86_03390 [Candidatus Thiodiazotropha sp. (ex Lucinoma kastoroae)]|nr:hypothetical protein [Candidatus Thiodiazotropha sp. (ex Lucinoma kastoroae)]
MYLSQIKEQIKQKSSREARTEGNPNNSDIDRELSRAGKKRKPDDIPKQDSKTSRGRIMPGNVALGPYTSSTNDTKGIYKIGPSIRPHIIHDTGFSKFPKRSPELADYWALFKWRSMLEGAETLRPDLSDGIAAYRHYLDGLGKPRQFSYERYVNSDNSGRTTLRNTILDAQNAAMKLWNNNQKLQKFSFSGPPIPCGVSDSKLPNVRMNFPYPATEKWQKAIGAHVIWLSGNVTVKIFPGTTLPPEFNMVMVLHAEDQYNFNPGATDIATGIPDSENGKFVVVGFAMGYHQSSTLRRSFSWKGFEPGVASVGSIPKPRHRQPQNNRASTNRI